MADRSNTPDKATPGESGGCTMAASGSTAAIVCWGNWSGEHFVQALGPGRAGRTIEDFDYAHVDGLDIYVIEGGEGSE